MRKKKRFFRSYIVFCAFFGFFTSAFGAQQIDPFYLQLLEKAQKSFLAKNYTVAARDFEIASFGLTADKALRAKALVYLSLSLYYLKDAASSEKYLTEAADLVGEKEFKNLQIAESAWPDLEKLLISFKIREAPKEATPPTPVVAHKSAKEKPKEPKKPEQKAPQRSAKKPPEKPAEQALPADKQPLASTAQEKPLDPGAVSPIKPEDKTPLEQPQSPQATLDKIKEGDLVPLDKVDTRPVIRKRVQAYYPAAARSFRIEGTVTVNALISEKGDVIKTEIITGIKSAFGFNQAAQSAVRQWKFEPATIKGIKVKVWMPITIDFRLQETG